MCQGRGDSPPPTGHLYGSKSLIGALLIHQVEDEKSDGHCTSQEKDSSTTAFQGRSFEGRQL